MTAREALIQAVGFIGTIFFFLSFQCRKNWNLFRMQLISYAFYSAHLLLLGAVTGGVSYLINLFRSACLSSRWKFARGKAMCAVICALQCAALLFTWNGWISLLPVAANVAATIGGYTHNARRIRLTGMLINSPLWIAYDLIVGSWAGLLDEAVSELSMIVSILRYGWKALDKTEDQ